MNATRGKATPPSTTKKKNPRKLIFDILRVYSYIFVLSEQILIHH